MRAITTSRASTRSDIHRTSDGAATFTGHNTGNNLGPGSPALDIKWVLDFRAPTFFKTYAQLLNIIYKPEPGATEPQQTDFFQVGSVNVIAAQIALPLIGTNTNLRNP